MVAFGVSLDKSANRRERFNDRNAVSEAACRLHFASNHGVAEHLDKAFDFRARRDERDAPNLAIDS